MITYQRFILNHWFVRKIIKNLNSNDILMDIQSIERNLCSFTNKIYFYNVLLALLVVHKKKTCEFPV